MVYPWSKKPKEEGIVAETEIKEVEKEKTEEVKEDNGKEGGKEN